MNNIPKNAHVAVLTQPREIKMDSFAIPEIGPDEMLVRVEGCGICGTDVHEYNRDPFALAPVVLGHEGTGRIVKLGENIKLDLQSRRGMQLSRAFYSVGIANLAGHSLREITCAKI